jgi:hypothetical protein
MLFLDILAEFLTEDLLYNKVKDYLAIRKGELKDAAFEKFYQTLVVDFINWQPGLDKEQAEKFLADAVTFDGVLAYLYNFTDPDSTIRDNTKAALCEWANRMRLSGSLGAANAPLMERFLARLEEELRRDANKSHLPHFSGIRGDLATTKSELQEEVGKAKEEILEKLEGLGEQWEKYAAEQKARAERATQIDPSGEQLIVAGKPVYDATQKVEMAPALPIIRCDLEAIDEVHHLYPPSSPMRPAKSCTSTISPSSPTTRFCSKPIIFLKTTACVPPSGKLTSRSNPTALSPSVWEIISTTSSWAEMARCATKSKMAQ